MVERVARTGLEIEGAFGGAPQDVEWAVAGGELQILQTRPITTALAPAPPEGREDRIVWSNTNLGELLPDAMTPLSWSVARRFVDDLLRALVTRLGMDLSRLPLLGLVAGRVYANMNSVAAIIRRIPGARRKSYADYFGGDQQALVQALGALREEDLPQADVSPLRMVLHLPGFVWWLLRLSDLKLPAWVADFQGFKPLTEQELRALPDERLSSLAEETMFFFASPERSDAIGYGLVGIVAMQQVAGLSRRWLGDADGSLGNRVLAGVGGIDSADAGLSLWALSDSARSRGLEAEVRGAAGFAALREALSASAPGREWLAEWDAFLVRHGHHARAEMDPAVPRWRELPEYLLGMVRTYLDAAPEASPIALHARKRAEREALQRELLGRLGFLKRRVFALVLDRAQRGMATRESAKSELARRAAAVRELIKESGRRLAERGQVDAPRDAFFLALEEQPDALAGRIAGLRELVRRRKAEHAANRALQPPPVVVGRFDPRRHLLPPPPSLRVLKGVSVSPGVAEGPARVLLTADSEERVRPGEDPGRAVHRPRLDAVLPARGGHRHGHGGRAQPRQRAGARVRHPRGGERRPGDADPAHRAAPPGWTPSAARCMFWTEPRPAGRYLSSLPPVSS
jgi:pyruvate,water dikinase